MKPRRAWFFLLFALFAGLAAAQGNDTDGNLTTGERDVGGGSPIDAPRILAALSAIIGLGFLGFLLFDRFRIADTLILIGFGVLLGPVWGLLDVELFRAIQPLVAVFALIIIMFDGGLDLDFRELAAGLGWSLGFSALGFFVTLAAVATVAHYLLAVPWLLALLLGAALGGTSGMVVMPLVGQLQVPPKVRTGLYVETFVPDLLAVTGVLVLLDVAQAGDVDLREATQGIAAGLSLALLVGLGAGLLWIRGLAWLATRRYAYMMTLAAVLLLYFLVEALEGSGPLAVLGFGLVLGNRQAFGAWGQVGRTRAFREMQSFNNEVAFLVRSFFFVFLGLVLDLSVFTKRFVAVSGLLLVALLASRALVVWATTGRDKQLRSHRGLLLAMMPRGLTAAVLVTLPAAVGLEGAEAFPAYAVVLVVLTNAVLTVGMYLFFRAATKPAPEAADEPASE